MNVIKEGAFIQFLTGPEKKGTGADALALAEKLGLRGRGGAAYPVADKLRSCMAFDGEKIAICNAFGKKGSVAAWLGKTAPWALLSGLRMVAETVGASKLALYYNGADGELEAALKAAGEDVLLVPAPDRLSCGEESILLSILNGGSPVSHIRPPYPSEQGVLIQSAETLAALAFGAETGESAGKLVLIQGAVEKPGIAEAESGMCAQQLLDAAGGMREGENFKALLIGDPLGALTPELGRDISQGVGCGRITVFSDKDCILDALKLRLNALTKESCGKCTLCREGVRQMAMLIENMTNGFGRPDDIDLLREVSEVIHDGASCGFGRLAAGMVLDALSAFGGEFESHLRRKRCDAMVCKKYTSFHILGAKCQGCEKCLEVCPCDAIDGEEDFIHVINQVDCDRCGKCLEVCEYEAIVQAGAIKPRTPPKPIPVGTWRGR